MIRFFFILIFIISTAWAKDYREDLRILADQALEKNKYHSLDIKLEFTSGEMNDEVEFKSAKKEFSKFFKKEIKNPCFKENLKKDVLIVLRPTSKGWSSDTTEKSNRNKDRRENYVSYQSESERDVFTIEFDWVKISVFGKYKYRLSLVTQFNFRLAFYKVSPLCANVGREEWLTKIITMRQKEIEKYQKDLVRIRKNINKLRE